MGLIVSYILIGLALSADASSVSIVYGTKFQPFRWKYALIPALAFGIAQGVMPAIGWFGGELISDWIDPYNRWIACIILCILGIKFIIDSRKDNQEEEDKVVLKPVPILLAAIATSIDACGVGVSISLDKQTILLPAVIFTVITFLCSLVCCRIGAKLGSKFGPRMLLIGGIVLICIGIKIVLGF